MQFTTETQDIAYFESLNTRRNYDRFGKIFKRIDFYFEESCWAKK